MTYFFRYNGKIYGSPMSLEDAKKKALILNGTVSGIDIIAFARNVEPFRNRRQPIHGKRKSAKSKEFQQFPPYS